jgi:hypothetical protein
MFAASLGITTWAATVGSVPALPVDETSDTTEIVNLLINERLASGPASVSVRQRASARRSGRVRARRREP